MTPSSVDSVLNAALMLPREDREALIGKLIDSLEQEEETPLSPEWEAEIQRRIEVFRRGEMKTTPAGEVMRSLSAEKRA